MPSSTVGVFGLPAAHTDQDLAGFITKYLQSCTWAATIGRLSLLRSTGRA